MTEAYYVLQPVQLAQLTPPFAWVEPVEPVQPVEPIGSIQLVQLNWPVFAKFKTAIRSLWSLAGPKTRPQWTDRGLIFPLRA